MNRYQYYLLATIFFVVTSNFSLATSIYPHKTYLQPIVDTNIFNLPNLNSAKFVKNCAVNQSGLNQIWNPSNEQVLIIDKKIEKEFDKPTSFEVIKLYFGLTNGSKSKKVYVYILPSKVSEQLSIDFGDDIRLCSRILAKYEFDINNFEIKKLSLGRAD